MESPPVRIAVPQGAPWLPGSPSPWCSPMPLSSPATAWAADLRLLERAGWSTVSDKLLRGLRHALAGRLTALMGVEEMLLAGEVDHAVARALGKETRRLRTMTLLMDLFPAPDSPGVMALDPIHHVRQALALHEPVLDWGPEHEGWVKAARETPAVLWNPTLLNRSLLLVIDGLAGSDGVVRAELGPGEGTRARIRMTGRTGSGRVDPTRRGAGVPLADRLRLISGILVRDGGAIRMRELKGTAQVELEIPGMPL